jgi:hypothetical protein
MIGQESLRKEIESKSNKRQRVDDHGQVNLTDTNNKKKQLKIYPVGSCRIHPLSIYHDDATCKQQKDGGTQRAAPTWAPCKFCSSKEEYKASAASHSDDRCRRNPAARTYKAPYAAPGSNSTTSQDPIVAAMAESNKALVQAMVTSLSKAIRGEADD